MDHAEGERMINEGERDGCGERITTTLEEQNNSRSNCKSSRANIMGVSMDGKNILLLPLV